MNIIKILLFTSLSILMFSCVSTKKYDSLNNTYQKSLDDNKTCQDNLNKMQLSNANLQETNNNLHATINELVTKNKDLAEQVDYFKKNSNQVLNTLQDLSVLSGKQAESMKESLKTLAQKDAYINNLQAAISRKDSLNLNLVMNLKKSLDNINDEDINIKVDKGVVYIDLSDKMLFNTAEFTVTDRAKNVLGKIANVLNAHPDLYVMVEGHTDSIPIHTTILDDNWDLSVKRATSVVRIL